MLNSRLKAAANAVYRHLKAQVRGDAFIMSLTPAAWYRWGVGVTSSSSLVSSWADQSGNNRPLLQTTDTNKPTLKADSSILFDGSDNFMRASFTLVQPCTSYVVWKSVASGASMRIVAGATAGTNFSFLRWNAGGTNTLIDAGTSAGDIATSPGTWFAECSVMNSTSSFHMRNTGVGTAVNTGTNNPGGITVGANQAASPAQFSNIEVREIIIFPSAHDEATRSRVMSYLLSMTS